VPSVDGCERAQSVRDDGRRDCPEDHAEESAALSRQRAGSRAATQQERRTGQGSQPEDRTGHCDGRQEGQLVTERPELGDRNGHERVGTEQQHESIERLHDECRPSADGQVRAPDGTQPRGERHGNYGEPRACPGSHLPVWDFVMIVRNNSRGQT